METNEVLNREDQPSSRGLRLQKSDGLAVIILLNRVAVGILLCCLLLLLAKLL